MNIREDHFSHLTAFLSTKITHSHKCGSYDTSISTNVKQLIILQLTLTVQPKICRYVTS